MRPVNLIPLEQRRGHGAAMRSGPLAYIIVGALVALLAGLVLLVLTNNQISDREAKVSTLEGENTAAEARAAELAAYVELQNVHNQRMATVSSLADSRFDWERVLRELALVLPSDVSLTNLTGTVKPDASLNGATDIALRAAVPGPALEMVGCAKGQDAVAGFVTALKSIDGVTRVAMQFSQLGGTEGSGESANATSGSASESSACQTSASTAAFQIVAAFDSAPISPAE